MNIRDGLSELSLKIAKYSFISACVTGSGGVIKHAIAKHTLNSIDEAERTGAMVEDGPQKRAGAVQEIADSKVITEYGGSLLGSAFGLGVLGGMLARSKKEDKQLESRRTGPSPTV